MQYRRGGLEVELDHLHQAGDDDDEHDDVQVGQLQGHQQKVIEGMRGHRSQCEDEGGGQSGGQRGIEAAGNAHERTQTQKLGQYKIIDQQCAK